MSDRFHPLSTEQLGSWIFGELDRNNSILGVPAELFFRPSPSHPFAAQAFGNRLETPIGVAAGPQSQLAQNIVAAWLCGARVIELKTVQTLDQIEVSKPCIDMRDAGYNVEWSQELSLDQSLDEYLRAWVLIHVLHRRLGLPGERPGVVFALSVGYDLEGIRQPNVERFLAQAADCAGLIAEHLETIARLWPEAAKVPVPPSLANNVTLSTMHGCPAHEIGDIAHHLMESWSLHTAIKLNPTLLGPELIHRLLSDRLGYHEIVVPAAAFEHDPRFDEAVNLITDLGAAAGKCGVEFSVKLANTLEVENTRDVFDPAIETMYLSGRPLHALVVQLAHRLTEALDGGLKISFAGGADALNVAELLAAGLSPVTTCSDLLRPTGYLRLPQYLSEIERAMELAGARTLDEFILRRAGDPGPVSGGDQVASAARLNLERYAERVLSEPTLTRDRFDRSRTKTQRPLGAFDCIEAPCTDVCAVDQRVPEYMRLVRQHRVTEAVAVTRDDNPLATILGRACHHPCERPCSRNHLDDPLAIREIKRFIMEHESAAPELGPRPARDVSVAIVGAGPCGLSAASFLARAGVRVTVFEARPASGGMVSATIPGYRANQRAVDQDLSRLEELGVETRHDHPIGPEAGLQSLRAQGFDYIVVAGGAQVGLALGIPGERSIGVWDGLEFLRAARAGTLEPPGARVAVIGGGDAAIDCARTARRIGSDSVTVLYRRTVAEMPAQAEELRGLIEEGIAVQELVSPRAVVAEGGRMTALSCVRNRLGDPDASGRRRPVELPDSEFEIPLEGLIVAIGQRAELALFGDLPVAVNDAGYLVVDPRSLETSISGIFAGGDMIGEGPATIVKACGDGRRIAGTILSRERFSSPLSGHRPADPTRAELVEILSRRSRRRFRVEVPELPPSERADFEEVVQTLSEESAAAEAERCLDCDRICSNCEWVCPNRAFLSYRMQPRPFRRRAFGDGDPGTAGDQHDAFAVEQDVQVAVLADLCNECGNCTTFCPTAGQPYRDKPRLYLSRIDFEAENDNAFMVAELDSCRVAQGRFGGSLHEVLVFEDRIHYATDDLRLELNLESDRITRNATGAPSEECATLLVLVTSIVDSMPWLPLAAIEKRYLLQADLL